MPRLAILAGALLCALTAAACTPQDAATLAAVIPPGVDPVSVQALDLAASARAAGVPAKTIVKAQAEAAKVQRYAAAACGAVPAVTSVAGLFLATRPGFATAKQIASFACSAITGRPTYAALGSRVGQTITRTVPVNGWDVPVTLTFVR